LLLGFDPNVVTAREGGGRNMAASLGFVSGVKVFSGSGIRVSAIASESDIFLSSLSASSNESTDNESTDVSPTGDPGAIPKKRLQVLIADDHEAVRRGLRSAVIGAGWDVCGEATNGRESIEQAQELRPDVVILDISMPIMGGLEAAPHILELVPSAKVVAFTMHESQQMKNEVARIGVHGLAVKSAPLSNLLQTIKSIVGT
jgi:CheY-like chemotaxis protein